MNLHPLFALIREKNVIRLFLPTLIYLLFIISFRAQGGVPQDQDTINAIESLLQSKDISVTEMLNNNYLTIPREKAREYVLKALSIAQVEEEEEAIARLFGILGTIEMDLGNFDTALYYRMKALEIYEETECSRECAQILSGIAQTYKEMDEYDASLEYSSKAREIALELNDSILLADAWSKMGLVYTHMGEYDKGLDHHLKAFAIHDHYNMRNALASDYNNIGTVYLMLKNTREAIRKLLSAAEIFGELGNHNNQANALHNAAGAFSDLGITDSSMMLAHKAMELWQSVDNKTNIPFAFNLIGRNHEALQHYDSAIWYYRRGLEQHKETGLKRGIAYSQRRLGVLFLDIRQYDSAKVHLEEALVMAREIGSKSLLQSVYNYMHALFKETGDYRRALEYYTLYSITMDSILNEQTSGQITEMRTKYETELTEKDNAILRKDLQAMKKQRRLIIINLFVAVALLVALSLVFYLRVLSARQKRALLEQKNMLLQQENELAEERARNMKEMLEFKERELVNGVMLLAKKNEMLNSVAERLKEAKTKLNEKSRREIQDIITGARRGIDDQLWHDFEARFNQVHPTFYRNLGRRFPALTPNELRLCAFLRLNLSTKDISDITFQSLKTIDVARSRLRSKLSIDRNESLSTFLAQF